MRITKPNEWFEERQEKNDKKHGYARLIWYCGRHETEYFKDGVRHGPEDSYKADGTHKQTQHYWEGQKSDNHGPPKNKPKPAA